MRLEWSETYWMIVLKQGNGKTLACLMGVPFVMCLWKIREKVHASWDGFKSCEMGITRKCSSSSTHKLGYVTVHSKHDNAPPTKFMIPQLLADISCSCFRVQGYQTCDVQGIQVNKYFSCFKVLQYIVHRFKEGQNLRKTNKISDLIRDMISSGLWFPTRKGVWQATWFI